MDKSLIPLADTGISLVVRGAVFNKDITYEEAHAAASQLVRLGHAVRWALVDVLMMSEGKWGEKYAQMLDMTQMSIGSLRNLMYVWNVFPRPEMRIWDLSISHYLAVCPSHIPYELKEELLQRAEDEQLSRDELRDIVKGYGPYDIIPAVFSREAFTIRVQDLIDWASGNGAPEDLIEAVIELFREFKESK